MGEPVRTGRLASAVPATGEAFHHLVDLPGALVEHIVSSAEVDDGVQVGPADEWVLLLQGSAQLAVEGAMHELRPGDWILLPAGVRHRVARTDRGTHWLAVHARSSSPAAAREVSGGDGPEVP